ncbi:MAG: hypothetical protein M3Q42_05730 [Pseudomonadota bacterium]|nr:hypothetical protein [Pseudomonadota bacterium]
MSLPWSAEQREWLQALGHPLLTLAADGSIDTAADGRAGEVKPGASPELAGRNGPSVEPIASEAVPGPAPVLHRALLKATRLPVVEAEQALRKLDVDLPALRADPDAKRRLWHRLRRLRRGTSG